MCVNYVHYYPQTQLELCKSAVDAGFLQKYFRLVSWCGSRARVAENPTHTPRGGWAEVGSPGWVLRAGRNAGDVPPPPLEVLAAGIPRGPLPPVLLSLDLA